MPTEKHSVVSSLGLLILRVGMGVLMMTHGWPKVQMLLDGNYEQFGDPIGLGKQASLILAASAEFLCPALIVLGLLTRLAAIGPVVTMVVAAFIVHQNDPWLMGEAARLFKEGEADTWASKEPALLYLIGFAPLIFTGPGKISVDALIWGGRRETN